MSLHTEKESFEPKSYSGVCLDVLFKGERSYIQGGDIYDSLSSLFWSEKGVAYIAKISFSRKTSYVPVISCEPEGSYGSFSVSVEKESYKFFLIESKELAKNRREYDEPKLLSGVEVNDKTAKLNFCSGYSAIEHVIALNKHVNIKRYGSEGGVWVFARARFENVLPSNFNKMELREIRLAGGKFTSNKIVIDGETFGEVDFMKEVV